MQQDALVSFFVVKERGSLRPKQVYRETKASARALMENPDDAGTPENAGPRQSAPDSDVREERTVSRQTLQQSETGTVKWFNLKKGYGFIVPDEGCVAPDDGGDVFVHKSGLHDEIHDLHDKEWVAYDVEDTPDGLEAQEVMPID